MKFGCCIQREEDIYLVKSAGYDFFEFSGSVASRLSECEFDSLCLESERVALPCIGFNAYSSGKPMIIGHGVSDEETAKYAELLCKRGKRLGISTLGIGAPNARKLPADMDMPTADAQFVRFIEVTAATARQYGIAVLIEAVNSGMCNYLSTTADAIKMTQLINLENVGMVLDFYHMSEMGEDYSLAAASEPYLRHVHLSTSGCNFWRGFPQEINADEYRRILSVLKSMGYNSTVSIEASKFKYEEAKSCLELLKRLEAENN